MIQQRKFQMNSLKIKTARQQQNNSNKNNHICRKYLVFNVTVVVVAVLFFLWFWKISKMLQNKSRFFITKWQFQFPVLLKTIFLSEISNQNENKVVQNVWFFLRIFSCLTFLLRMIFFYQIFSYVTVEIKNLFITQKIKGLADRPSHYISIKSVCKAELQLSI